MTKQPDTPIFVANWKMHGNVQAVQQFVSEISGVAAQMLGNSAIGARVIFCPPSCYLPHAVQAMQPKAQQHFAIGAQASHKAAKGAHTGDVSAQMLRDLGVCYSLVGHSEIRTSRGLNDEDVAQEAQALQQAHVTPIICIGESLADYESGQTNAVLSRQLAPLHTVLQGACMLAYEPVWAIGTGKTPGLQEIEAAHQHIKAEMKKLVQMGQQVRDSQPPLLYGGSVKVKNIAAILAQPSVDGVLVGSASLECDGFKALLQAGVEKNLQAAASA